jgi:hypothetical protein
MITRYLTGYNALSTRRLIDFAKLLQVNVTELDPKFELSDANHTLYYDKQVTIETNDYSPRITKGDRLALIENITKPYKGLFVFTDANKVGYVHSITPLTIKIADGSDETQQVKKVYAITAIICST